MTIKQPTNSWLQFITKRYEELINCQPIPFQDLVPSKIPKAGGVYLITARIGRYEHAYYVGRTKNLRQRLYNNHLMGPLTNARLKKYLIGSGECTGIEDAKELIRSRCYARWIEESDIRNRGAIEGYTTGLLFPKYGIYEEH